MYFKCFILDTETEEWREAPTTLSFCGSHQTSTLIHKTIYIIGGTTEPELIQYEFEASYGKDKVKHISFQSLTGIELCWSYLRF